MFLAYRYVGVVRLQIHVDVEDLRDRLLHLHEPLLADIVNGILVAVDDIAGAISTIEVLLLLVVALKLWRCREAFLVRRAVGATVDMSEARIA